ncbi:MAG: NUDIX domain-containing protein [Bacteroidota bacterium]
MFQKTASELIMDAPPDTFNQAIMEFGAMKCTPSKPDCPRCIFFERCLASKTDMVSRLPVKAKKQKVRDRYFNYLVVRNRDDFYLKKRSGSGIWKNLWEFPMIESEFSASEDWVLQEASALFDTKGAIYRPGIDNRIHQLSHQRLHAAFHEFILKTEHGLPEDWKKVDTEKLFEFPLPRLIELFLKGQSEA